MTDNHSWYNAALRRKKIAADKRLRHQQYIDEMNKAANEPKEETNERD